MKKRKTIRDRIESFLDYSKCKFKEFERKDWNENNGTSQCTNDDGLYFHAQATLCDELLKGRG